MNIKNIIKESLKLYLSESLKTQRQKYGNKLVDELKDLDPSKNYKYIDQICKFYKEGIDKNEIETYIKLYDEKLNKNLIPIEYRDINKVKNFDELKDIVDNIQKQKSKRLIKSFNFNDLDVEKQFYKKIKNNKGKWAIYKPYNTIQQIKLGKNTKWCISYTTADNWFNNYFINHNVVFYIFINYDNQKEKYQIQIYPNNRGREIYNQEDKKITDKEFEEQTGINPNDFKWYNQSKEINPLIVYDKNGNIIGKYINGKKEGKWIEYNNDGSIHSILHYEDDKLDGECIEYYPNGNISTKCMYVDNKKFGKYIKYYENGNIKIEQNYFFNVLNGKSIIYYPNGNIMIIEYYKNNHLNGKYIYYYPNGNISEITYYKDNNKNGEYKEYYLNGNIKIKQNYKNDNKDGKYIEYYENGVKKIECNYKNGNLYGEYKEYYPNGNLHFLKHYKYNMLSGKFIEYYEDGKIKKEYNYEDD